MHPQSPYGLKAARQSAGGEAVACTAAPVDYDVLMDAYLASCNVKQSSRDTYRKSLGRFFDWIRNTGRHLQDMRQADIIAYNDELLAKGMSPLTVGSYLVAVRMFYQWAEAEKLYPNIAKHIRKPRRKKGFIKQHLSQEEAASLLEYLRVTSPEEKSAEAIARAMARSASCGRQYDENRSDAVREAYRQEAVRNHAMAMLMLATGLRTVEVCRADVGDITTRSGQRILRVWGKGHNAKDALVVLNDETYGYLKEYLSTRPCALSGEPLFVSEAGHGHTGGRMTPRMVQKIIKDAMEAIGLEGHDYSAHSLRHTTAVTILRNGGDWLDVQRVLRHASVATSQVYWESIEEEQRLENAPEVKILQGAFTK